MGRRRKRRRRGARARANVELGAHIASLGLESKRDYRRWRRDHGLSGGLQGTWRERTAERKILARDVAREAIRAERVASVEAVRVASMDPWFAWCRQHGAGWSAGRSRSRLARAVSAECGRRGDAALLAARGVSHRPGRMIQKLRAGELSRDDMMTAQHTSVFDAFALADRQPGAGEALRRLVACVGASHETLSLEPVVREFGRRPGNTQLGGLSALALRQGECRRPPEDWAPTTHNARRRFGSLARWLLTTYDVPRFLDTAWFAGQRLEARAQQQWFVDVGLGRNIRRSAHLPVVLTKRMAHLLMHGGETVAVSVAMRRAQVLGMGGSEALARAVTRSRLGGSFEHEEFWVSVVKFLVYSPSVAPDDVEPIVEYVYEQKYAPQRVADAEGFVEEGPPMHPGFSMRTRKAAPLIREVSVWRRERERRRSHYAEEWEPCGLKGLDVVEHADGRWVRWRVRELLSVTALRTEGKRMRHCVGTHHGYASACRSGSQSIWSLDATDSTGKRVSGMTIALRNGDRTITEAMGKGNVNLAGLETDDPRRTWLGLCRAIMERWAVPQGITSARPA